MQYKLTFGVGYDRNGRRLEAENVQEAVKAILTEACLAFGGCNLVNGQGAWLDFDGNLVVEETRTLIIDGPDDQDAWRKVDKLAARVRQLLRQSAVHVAIGHNEFADLSDDAPEFPHARRFKWAPAESFPDWDARPGV